MTKLEILIAKLQTTVKSSGAELEKFTNRFSENPIYAFEWSTGAFAAAAEKHVAMTILAWFENWPREGKDEATVLREVYGSIMDTALSAASRVEGSSSKTCNLVKDYERAAWAEWTRDAKFYI